MWKVDAVAPVYRRGRPVGQSGEVEERPGEPPLVLLLRRKPPARLGWLRRRTDYVPVL